MKFEATQEIEVTNMIIGGDAKNLLNAMELENKDTVDMQAWPILITFLYFKYFEQAIFESLFQFCDAVLFIIRQASEMGSFLHARDSILTVFCSRFLKQWVSGALICFCFSISSYSIVVIPVLSYL